MGYYTRYELNIWEMNMVKRQEIYDYIEAYDDDFYGLGEDVYKWYNHENKMRELSLEFEDIVFELRGEGEESGDIWIKYFKNGLMQECYAEITFPEFDESKLK